MRISDWSSDVCSSDLRDTYHLFGLETGVPTDAYGLEEAVADGYLVPPRAQSVPVKFVREGIRYDELSEEEKEHWESLDWGDYDELPDEIHASEVNKRLFNEHTVDLMLQHLMEHGLKVDGGDRLGKTIIFAVNQRSEEHTSELQSLMRISYAVFCLKKKNRP